MAYNQQEPGPLMTPAEVSAALNVTTHAAGKWADAGLVRCVRRGRTRRYVAEDILAIAGPGDGPFIKPSDLAKILRVSAGTASEWIASGRVPAIRLPGGHYRVRESAARALIAGQTDLRADAEHAL